MSARRRSNSGAVYSSDHGEMCPNCNRPMADCTCRQNARQGTSGPSGDGVVRVSRETKGRKGKGVTVITGVPLDPNGIKELARELKQRCGTGGTVKDGAIEIQGDHRDVLVVELKKHGWTVKRSGG